MTTMAHRPRNQPGSNFRSACLHRSQDPLSVMLTINRIKSYRFTDETTVDSVVSVWDPDAFGVVIPLVRVDVLLLSAFWSLSKDFRTEQAAGKVSLVLN